jgi:hypothetical protein
MRPLRSTVVWLALLAVCCKRADPAPSNAGAPSKSGSSVAVARHLLDPGAFDLVSSNEGAALIWANRGTGQLELSVFDDAGKALRSEPLVPSLDAGAPTTGVSISEVAATVHGSELAVAWLERGSTSRARGFVRPLNGGSAGRIVELGGVLEPVSVPRGNLAVTNHDGHFTVLSRGLRSDCIDPSAHDCVSFGFHRLDAKDAKDALDQGLPLTVPLPCAQGSVSFAVTGSRWYYGVCSQSTGKPVTTLFSIQPDPEYARADRLLEGCLPLGALAQNGELWLVGDCVGEGQRHGVRVRAGNAEPLDLRVDRLEAVCQSGSPLIRQTGPAGMILPLITARDRLEAFLPQSLAPVDSRAVWTGRTLLVAAAGRGTITLKGYQCDSTLLREVVLPSAPLGSGK